MIDEPHTKSGIQELEDSKKVYFKANNSSGIWEQNTA